MTVPIENRLVALGTWQLAHFIFSLFANTVWTNGPIGLGETIIDVLRHREYDCACWQAIGGTWHMPIAIGTILIFSPFANNIRTAGPIATGRGTDRYVFDLGKIGLPIENRLVALGTWQLAQFIFSLFANTVWTAGPIGLGETIIDVFRPREDDGALLGIDRWHLAHADWHNPHF